MNGFPSNAQISFPELIAIVKTLSVSEKQLLTEVLWDDNMPVLEEHQRIVKERMEKSNRQPDRMLNWESVSKSIIQ